MAESILPNTSRAMESPSKLSDTLRRSVLLRQLASLVAIAATIAIGVGVVLWSQDPSYDLLFSRLPAQELGEVVESLDKRGVKYKVEAGSGSIMVPADEVSRIRMALAAEGLPRSPAQGYGLLDEESGLGISQFREKTRYHRALEGELVRTISAITSIRSARVHLAIPKKSMFLRKQGEVSASVFLDLFAGRSLNAGKVAAIVHLVSSSVPQLDAERVTVVDQSGSLLSSKGGDSKVMGLSNSQFEYAQKVEASYVEDIINLLTPLVGQGKVQARVSARINFTAVEETTEDYSDKPGSIRSERVVSKKKSALGSADGGIPGAKSNKPSGRTPTNSNKDTRDTSKNIVRNFELDRTVRHVRRESGNLERLSIAVLIDEKSEVDEDGVRERIPYLVKELKEIEALVKESVGFDKARGDTFNLMSKAFWFPEAVDPQPEPQLWEKPWIWDVAKQITAGLGVLLLIFFVLRPMLGNLNKGMEVIYAKVAEADSESAGALPGHESSVVSDKGSLATFGSYENVVQAAQSVAVKDPSGTAQVVEGWMNES